MSYETGSTSTLTQLLTRLGVFAQANGWTVDKFDTAIPALFLHNAAGYWSMMLTGGVLTLYGNTGFNGSVAASAQPGSSLTNNSTSAFAGTRCEGVETGNYVSYDFFGTDRYLHVAVQVATNQFRHFGIGTLIKTGQYDGGQYVYGTAFLSYSALTSYNAFPFGSLATANNWGDSSSIRYSTVVRADLDASPRWCPFGRLSGNNLIVGWAMGLGDAGAFNSCHPDILSGQTAISQFGQVVAPVPNIIYCRTADNVYRQLGIVPDFYVCRMPGIAPRSDFDIAGERWRLIPPMQIQTTTGNAPAGQNNSYDIGYAFKVV